MFFYLLYIPFELIFKVFIGFIDINRFRIRKKYDKNFYLIIEILSYLGNYLATSYLFGLSFWGSSISLFILWLIKKETKRYNLIGLTGGICCGKSTFTNIIRNQYYKKVVDFDDVAHKGLLPGRKAF